MHAGHFKEVCTGCGTVITQCRCPDPNKEVRKGMCQKCVTQKKMATPEKDFSLDKLQAESEKLVALLKERETGNFTWLVFLNERMKSLHDMLCPLFKK